MQRGKRCKHTTCEYARGQNVQTYKGAKHTNMQRPKCEYMQTHAKGKGMQT